MPIRISPLDELMEIEKLPLTKNKKMKRVNPKYGAEPEYGMTVKKMVRTADDQMNPDGPKYRAGRIDSDSQPRTPDYKFGPDETAADQIKAKPMAAAPPRGGPAKIDKVQDPDMYAAPQAKPMEPNKIQLPRLLEESEIDFNDSIRKLKPRSSGDGARAPYPKPMKPDKIELPDY